jgi:transposase-like protein
MTKKFSIKSIAKQVVEQMQEVHQNLCQGELEMVEIPLKCLHCGSTSIVKDGNKNGKQRYRCKNEHRSHKRFDSERLVVNHKIFY